MHIQKIDAGDGFYATAWCGEKIGMLDNAYMSVDNALKAMEKKEGSYPCQHCLSNILKVIQQNA